MKDILSLTEHLYTAKIFLLAITCFNALLALYSAYVLSVTGNIVFSLLAAVTFVFNALFAWVAIKNWNSLPGEKQNERK